MIIRQGKQQNIFKKHRTIFKMLPCQFNNIYTTLNSSISRHTSYYKIRKGDWKQFQKHIADMHTNELHCYLGM